jgi:hypothetical protein
MNLACLVHADAPSDSPWPHAFVHLRLLCSGPIPVDGGRRCGNEGGLKRCCKQHRAALIMLSDHQGQPLPGAAHLDALASMLKVMSTALVRCSRGRFSRRYMYLCLLACACVAGMRAKGMRPQVKPCMALPACSRQRLVDVTFGRGSLYRSYL